MIYLSLPIQKNQLDISMSSNSGKQYDYLEYFLTANKLDACYTRTNMKVCHVKMTHRQRCGYHISIEAPRVTAKSQLLRHTECEASFSKVFDLQHAP